MAGIAGGRLHRDRHRPAPGVETAAEPSSAQTKRTQCDGPAAQHQLKVFSRCQGLNRIVAEHVWLGNADQTGVWVQTFNQGAIDATRSFFTPGLA